MAKENKDNDLFSTLFGEDYISPQFASDNANTAIEALVGKNANRVNDESWAAYDALAKANPGYIAAQQKVGDDLMSKLGLMSGRLASSSPETAAGRWADAQLGRYKDAMASAIGADSATAKLARARLGYAGRPDSSFDSLMRTQDYAKASLPMINQILGQASSDAGSFAAGDRANMGTLMAYLSGMPDFYNSMADAYLRPARAANYASNSSANSLNNFINAARNNFLGFEQKRKHGIGDYINTGTELLASSTGNLASAAGNVMGMMGGMGGIGGMLGGMGGGGGIGSLFGGMGGGGGGGGKGGGGYGAPTGGWLGGGGGSYAPSGWGYAGGGSPGWDTSMWGN